MRGGMSKGVGVEPDWENDLKKACAEDSDVKSFHEKLEADKKQIINTLENGRVKGSLPLDSLKVITSRLAEIDERLKNLILKHQKEIQKNHKLSELVDEYLQQNVVTSEFYNKLHNWLERLDDSRRLLENALRCIEPANPDRAQYTKCKDKLAEFKTAVRLFNEEFSHLLNDVREKHEQIQKKLKAIKDELDRKLRRVRVWRKFSIIIFVAAAATVLICSVVAVAMTAPPLAVAILAAPSLPIASMGKWVNHKLTEYEKKIKVDCDVTKVMEEGTRLGLFELNQISGHLDRLEATIRLILGKVDFYFKDEDDQHDAVEVIREKQQGFKDQIDNLKDAVEYIREKRQSFKDQTNSQNAVVEDIKKK